MAHLLGEIVRTAYGRAVEEHPQLLDLLKAHRRVCLARAIPRVEADEAYRTLLRLSLDPDPDWYGKLEVESAVSGLWGTSRASLARRKPPRPLAEAGLRA